MRRCGCGLGLGEVGDDGDLVFEFGEVVLDFVREGGGGLVLGDGLVK